MLHLFSRKLNSPLVPESPLIRPQRVLEPTETTTMCAFDTAWFITFLEIIRQTHLYRYYNYNWEYFLSILDGWYFELGHNELFIII